MKVSTFFFFSFVILHGCSITLYADCDDSLTIHNLGHASVMLEFDGKVIHIDLRNSEADYANLPDADIICITHEQNDHYDLKAINEIKKESTVMMLTPTVKALNSYDGETVVMINGDNINLKGIAIEAVPSYNIDDGNGESLHVKGVGNGCIFTFNDLRVYLTGDTHNIPEMAGFNVDIAFIPMNQPYTMSPEMAADAAKVLHPKIVYIYHYGTSDLDALRTLLQDEPMEVRIGASLFVEPTKANGSTGLLPVLNNNKFTVYPNPSNGLITQEQSAVEAELLVFDMKGQLVFKKEKLESGSNSIDLRMLNSGNYLLEVNSATASSEHRLVSVMK